MIGAEIIRDPNVAAYYAHYAAFRVVVVAVPTLRRASFWSRLFMLETPNDDERRYARRIGTTLYVSQAFRDRMEPYLQSYRLEARERRAGYEVDCCRRDGGH